MRRGREEGSAASALLFLQVNPEGAGDEDSCSSSAPLSPSSSPQSMASGSVCPPGKCVCSSCGLEIVDKYLLKVGLGWRAREPLWGSGKRALPRVSRGALDPLSKAVLSRAHSEEGKVGFTCETVLLCY